MIPELGQIALALALAVAIIQAVLPLAGAANGNRAWIAVARPAAQTQALLVAFAERGIDWHPERLVRELDPIAKVARFSDGAAMPYDLFLGVPVHRAPEVVELVTPKGALLPTPAPP